MFWLVNLFTPFFILRLCLFTYYIHFHISEYQGWFLKMGQSCSSFVSLMCVSLHACSCSLQTSPPQTMEEQKQVWSKNLVYVSRALQFSLFICFCYKFYYPQIWGQCLFNVTVFFCSSGVQVRRLCFFDLTSMAVGFSKMPAAANRLGHFLLLMYLYPDISLHSCHGFRLIWSPHTVCTLNNESNEADSLLWM